MMRFAAGNAQHIGDRPEQEDAFGFSDPARKDFVAHGGFVGGLAHGREASSTAVRAFISAYEAKPLSEPIAEALTRSLHEANKMVLSLAEKASQLNRVGTTIVAVVVDDASLHWISAGDSRIY